MKVLGTPVRRPRCWQKGTTEEDEEGIQNRHDARKQEIYKKYDLLALGRRSTGTKENTNHDLQCYSQTIHRVLPKGMQMSSQVVLLCVVPSTAGRTGGR